MIGGAASHAKMPFMPPASACGLACMLMLLEGAEPQKVFCSSPLGPNLALQTLWVRSLEQVTSMYYR